MKDYYTKEEEEQLNRIARTVAGIMLFVIFVIFLIFSAKASGQDYSRFGGSLAVYAPINQNEAEYGRGAKVHAEVFYKFYETENQSLRVSFVHESYFSTGWPFDNGTCSYKEVHYCESAFDGLGLRYEANLGLFMGE